MNQRLHWWYGRTAFFEACLLLVVLGWAVTLLATDVFTSNVLYQVMSEVAPQTVWGQALLAWIGLYGWALWRMSYRGRVVCLLLMVWWWTVVAVMLYRVSPISTGVVTYGSLALMSSAAALYHIYIHART